ncbi:helix-turn-helix transcriptional regulator [bacterium]|nr:helix-turn-helix transcriptional regulator [bacterium]
MNLVALRIAEDEENISPLGPLVGKLSKKLKVKQTDLAKKTEISRISVNRFFRGKSEVRASDLVQILELMGIDVEAQIYEKLKS